MKNAKVLQKEVLLNKFGKRFVHEKLSVSDGTKLDWYYLDTPKSVIIVPVTKDGKLILIRQYRHNLRKFVYELPAGFSGLKNSSFKKAAETELLEETGYVPEKLINLGSYYNLPSETNRRTGIFLAVNVQKREKPKLDDFIEKYFDMSIKTFDFAEIVAGIGQKASIIESIEHGFSLLLAEKYLKGKK